MTRYFLGVSQEEFPPEALIELYRRHWMFLLPSVFEGIPLSMLEAMACGLCPVVSDVGGVRDVVTDGANGVLVPRLDVPALAAALARALRDPAGTRAIGSRAQQSMQAYGWSRPAEQVEHACLRRWGG